MPISVSTNFYPYRLDLSKKKPIELKVDLVNRSDKETMITLQVIVARQLALDKTGLKTNAIKRIDRFRQNEKQGFVFDIFPKGYVSAGDYPVVVKVMEHYNYYDYVEREYTKNLTVSVKE